MTPNGVILLCFLHACCIAKTSNASIYIPTVSCLAAVFFVSVQGASYWARLLFLDSQEGRYCSVHKQCNNQTCPRSLQWQAVHVQCALLLAGASTGQLLCSVLQHHMQSNVQLCGPCTEHQQRKIAQGKTIARTEGVIYDTIQAVKLPVMHVKIRLRPIA